MHSLQEKVWEIVHIWRVSRLGEFPSTNQIAERGFQECTECVVTHMHVVQLMCLPWGEGEGH